MPELQTCAFAMNQETQVLLYQKIITGQQVPDWIIDVMLSRPGNLQQKTSAELERQRRELDKIRRCNRQQPQRQPLRQELDQFSAHLNNLQQIRILLRISRLPAQYRLKVWPMTSRMFDCEAGDFLQFAETPQFLSKLHNLKLDEAQADDKELAAQINGANTVPQADEGVGQPTTHQNALCSQPAFSQAIEFVKTHPLILNDINRTLSSTQLFAENQPLFPQLCTVVACCAVRNDNYVQGLSLAAAVVLMHLMDVKETLKVMFRVMNCRVYQNFLMLDEQRLQCYSVFFFKAVVKSFQRKAIVKQLKLTKLPIVQIQEKLQHNLYDFLLGSLAGLVLSLFAKRGASFSAFALDLITTAENPHECIFELSVSYIVCVSGRYLQDGNQEQLINQLTKQGDDGQEFAEEVKNVWRELNGAFSEELSGLQKLVVLV